MIKPFQIVWELIEFGIQALFVYVLVIIIFIGIIATIIYKEKNKEETWSKAIEEAKVEYVKECTRIDGCRVRKDGTIEWWNMNKTTLAALVYYKGLEERMREKYLKRIEYLVEANNELMRELEQYEKISMSEKV